MAYDYQDCKCRGRFDYREENRERRDDERDERRDDERDERRDERREDRREDKRGEERREDKREDRREEKIKNKSFIEVEACGKKHKIESNEVEARKINLLIREEQNCDFVFAGDEIEYKVRIFNDSHMTVRNVEFEDFFNDCGEYKRDSFKVNGRKECPHVHDRHIKYRIHEIQPHEEIVITFEIFFKK